MTTSFQIIKSIVSSNEKIDAVSLVEFPNTLPLHKRLSPDEFNSEAVDQALKTRSDLKFPFWDSLLATQFKNNVFSEQILQAATFHNPITERIIISRNELDSIEIYATNSHKNYGINSIVITNSSASRMHLPLLDFHIPYEPKNDRCVEATLKTLHIKGYLFKTNKSYHFIGKQIFTELDFRLFLSKALLLSPIIDKNWISHQLIENSCTLRITPKAGLFPILIKEID